MIISTFYFDNAICISKFTKTAEKGEFLLEFNAISIDGKLLESDTKIVSDHYVRSRLNTCRVHGGTISVIKSGVVTYKCYYE